MTTQIEPVDRAAIAQIVIDELQANPQRLLPEALAQKVNTLEQGQQAIIAEQQTLAAGQQAIVAEQQVIVAEQKTLAAGQQAIVAEQQVIVAEQKTLAAGQQAIVAEQQVIVAEQKTLAAGQQAIVAEQQVIVAEQRTLAEGQQAIIAEQQVMAARMTRIENDLGSVKGWGLELLCARRPGMIGQRLDLLRVRTVDPGEVAEMAADALDSGTITRAEHDQIILADVIYRGVKDSDRTPCYAVLEVSYVVDINDVRRAIARADILSRITKMDAVSVVAGDRITEGAQTAAETHAGISNVDDVIYIQVQNGAQLRS